MRNDGNINTFKHGEVIHAISDSHSDTSFKMLFELFLQMPAYAR